MEGIFSLLPTSIDLQREAVAARRDKHLKERGTLVLAQMGVKASPLQVPPPQRLPEPQTPAPAARATPMPPITEESPENGSKEVIGWDAVGGRPPIKAEEVAPAGTVEGLKTRFGG